MAKPHANTVYVVCEEGAQKPVKIGIAVDVKARLASLQTGNPRKLVVKHTVRLPLQYAQCLEPSLHEWFAGRKVIGEWFNVHWKEAAIVADKLAEYIEENGTLPLTTGLPALDFGWDFSPDAA